MKDTYSRRESIKELLKNGVKVTAKQMADRFGVSVNTIKNDISFISEHFPVTTELGRNGGYRFVGSRTAEINESEARALDALMRKHRGEMAEEIFYSILGKISKLIK